MDVRRRLLWRTVQMLIGVGLALILSSASPPCATRITAAKRRRLLSDLNHVPVPELPRLCLSIFPPGFFRLLVL
ncbi:hypothetical protein EJ03DRAFT_331658 [Teratosphaeria nubilosa]|uniref:Uncharacterized protein n=1 Tax=Teratosphaeria nubilosa TaxID=161662 RepID=A0A6G1KWL7_9PEZI|nr:hypothetical protein EJ03DRAFT_331658 [Teratosphaeria nubilosa]